MNKLELFYARLNFRFDTDKRLGIYRKLSSLLRNDFSLMDALDRVYMVESNNAHKPHEPFAIIILQIRERLEQGLPFQEAMRGFATNDEVLMLTSGDVSRLADALDNVVRVTTAVSKIRADIWSAAAYPVFLFLLTFAIIAGVGIYMVPPLAQAAGGDVVWRGAAGTLVGVSDFIVNNWIAVAVGIAAMFIIIWMSLSRWTGRARAVFDKIPPWSIYKQFVSVGWMMSLSAIMSSGGNLPDAMKLLADNAPPYLRDILTRANRLIANGDNLGVALANINRDFPNNEIIGDLEVYAEMNNFDKNITRVADDYLDSSSRRITALSGTLNSAGIILVSLVIMFIVFGVFAMQDQLTGALS